MMFYCDICGNKLNVSRGTSEVCCEVCGAKQTIIEIVKENEALVLLEQVYPLLKQRDVEAASKLVKKVLTVCSTVAEAYMIELRIRLYQKYGNHAHLMQEEEIWKIPDNIKKWDDFQKAESYASDEMKNRLAEYSKKNREYCVQKLVIEKRDEWTVDECVEMLKVAESFIAEGDASDWVEYKKEALAFIKFYNTEIPKVEKLYEQMFSAQKKYLLSKKEDSRSRIRQLKEQQKNQIEAYELACQEAENIRSSSIMQRLIHGKMMAKQNDSNANQLTSIKENIDSLKSEIERLERLQGNIQKNKDELEKLILEIETLSMKLHIKSSSLSKHVIEAYVISVDGCDAKIKAPSGDIGSLNQIDIIPSGSLIRFSDILKPGDKIMVRFLGIATKTNEKLFTAK